MCSSDLRRQSGCGLDEFVRWKAGASRLAGIMNGIDDAWDPESDTHIARNYSQENFLEARVQCKVALQEELGLISDPSAALLGFDAGARLPLAPQRSAVVMSSSRGPFPLPEPPAGFDGAQWAPHCFPPFEISIPTPAVSEAAASLKEEIASLPAEPSAVSPAAAPPAKAPTATTPGNFAVTLKTPDGDLSFEIAPDTYILDHTDELAEDNPAFEDLPYACRAEIGRASCRERV